jgi:hypothetical protein
MATYSNPKFYRSNFMAQVTLDDGTIINDIFDRRLVQLIRNISSSSNILYNDSMKLCNLSFSFYGTTSLDWVILVYNGFIHPYEIPSAITLLVPSYFDVVRSISNYLTQTSTTINI